MTPPPYGHGFLTRLLAGAGIMHLLAPHVFDGVIPDWVPGPARTWTVGSGIAELLVAGMLAWPRTRRLGGWAAAALFVAVFPANVDMAWQRRNDPVARVITLARLPLQLPLILWAIGVGRARAAATLGAPPLRPERLNRTPGAGPGNTHERAASLPHTWRSTS